MDIFQLLVPVFILAWSLAFPCASLYLNYLKNKYDTAVLPGCRIKTQRYRWKSKEIWEKSITMEASLLSKTSIIFSPVGIFIVISWFFLKSFRLYISLIGAIFFIITMLIVIIKGIKLHKSFCPHGWYWTSYNYEKFIGIEYL
ncbi:MAG: hypothetical protein ACTTGZ_05555 [Treponema sp.]